MTIFHMHGTYVIEWKNVCETSVGKDVERCICILF